MKTIKLLSLLFAGIFTLQACHNSNKEKQSETLSADSALTTLVNGKQTKLSKQENEFIEKAAVGSMMEIEIGNNALQKSKDSKIKDLAKMIISDHTKANHGLDSLAKNKGLKLPSTFPVEEQKHINAMKELSGNAFDRHYLEMMVTDHISTLEEFRKASRYDDPDIKAFAAKFIPVLEGHYKEANKLDSLLLKQKTNNGDDILDIDKNPKK